MPDDTVEEAMQVMTERRIRHLPILEDGELRGAGLDRRLGKKPMRGVVVGKPLPEVVSA
ncbi:MAG: CBS domain-containing protein [Pirellulales bacterium]